MWLGDGRAQGHSPKTDSDRRDIFKRFIWWLEQEAGVQPHLEELSPELLRRFLVYCREPHPTGRFGSSHANSRTKARPATVHRYFRELRTFCNFCVNEGLLPESPVQSLKSPLVPHDPVQPFSPLQLRDLINAAAQTLNPDRNRTILMVLVDTGLRVSELCSLTVGDVQRQTGEISVLGKGGKRRTVYLGTAARRVLRLYLMRVRAGAAPEEPLLLAQRGHHPGEGMKPTGVYQVVQECGRLARIDGVRCSPHTLRHTFAIQFLRGGGNLLELQRLMGHTDLTILRRYVQLAESDLERAHRQASPADRLGLR